MSYDRSSSIPPDVICSVCQQGGGTRDINSRLSFKPETLHCEDEKAEKSQSRIDSLDEEQEAKKGHILALSHFICFPRGDIYLNHVTNNPSK